MVDRHHRTFLSHLLPVIPLFIQICGALPHPQQQEGQPLKPLLTTISQDSELSVFYSLFSGTGGPDGIPGPALEERFNDDRDGRNYTAFAPTNEAFSDLPPELSSALKSPPSYELLLGILRTHIAEGDFSASDLLSGRPIEAIEGFTLNFDNTHTSNTTITTNVGISKPSPNAITDTATQALLLHDEEGPDSTRAANGRIYKLSRVLDPFITYFGEDPHSTGPPVTPSAADGSTMADVLRTHPDLTTLAAALEDINPDFLTRLSLFTSPAEEQQQQQQQVIYLAPSNAAFDVLPGTAFDRTVQPSNVGLSAWLLGFGLTGEIEAGGAGTAGPSPRTRRDARRQDCDLVFRRGGWHCRRGRKEKREAAREKKKKKCDWVFRRGGWHEVCRRDAEEIEMREADPMIATDSQGCDWRFGTNGWHQRCPRGLEKRERCNWKFNVGGWHRVCPRDADQLNPRSAEASDIDSGCNWGFGMGGWKKACPRGTEFDKRSLEKRCDLQFDVGGWKRVCPRSLVESSAGHLAKRQDQIPKSGVLRSVSGFNITLSEGRVNNAQVEEVICADNGCVWIVGRWLDPIFGVF